MSILVNFILSMFDSGEKRLPFNNGNEFKMKRNQSQTAKKYMSPNKLRIFLKKNFAKKSLRNIYKSELRPSTLVT